jgi:hypothetical protein
MAGPGSRGPNKKNDPVAQAAYEEAHRRVLALARAGVPQHRIAEVSGYSDRYVGEIVRFARRFGAL